MHVKGIAKVRRMGRFPMAKIMLFTGSGMSIGATKVKKEKAGRGS